MSTDDNHREIKIYEYRLKFDFEKLSTKCDELRREYVQ